jgi:hypothetical protein
MDGPGEKVPDLDLSWLTKTEAEIAKLMRRANALRDDVVDLQRGDRLYG